jgi:uncharacterized protein (TIGR02231 family)
MPLLAGEGQQTEAFMRSLTTLSLLLASTASVMSAEIRGSSRIDAVTVYPLGAEVTRVGRVTMEGGEHVILFTDLPAQAVPGSLRVEGRATGTLEIGSVDSRRVSVPRSDSAVAATERRQTEDAIEKLKDERAVLQAAVEAAQAQKALINNLANLPVQPSAPNSTATQPDWSQLFTLIGQRSAEAQKTVLDAQIRIRETDRQIADLTRKLTTVAPTQEERTEVKVFVNAAGGLDADLMIRYQVRAASWTPFYDARLTTGTRDQAPKLQLIRRASIQQRTGESWDDVQLALSTARPGAGSAAPILNPMTVDYAPDPAPQAQPRQPTVSGGDRDFRGRVDGQTSYFAKSASEKTRESNRLEEAPADIVDEISTKVEAQTFQAVYAIAGRIAVPTTGEMKRVQIDEVALDPVLTARTVPKAEQKAYLYAKLTVARGTPVLPGTVSLFRDATFVGNGQLPLLAPGEEHELGFGVDDLIRVRHAVVDDKRGETGLIATSKTDVRNYRITVKNLHERPIQLRVLDQIPVAQNDAIKIELQGRTAPTRRDVEDKRGVMAWDMALTPDEEKAVEFGYRVTWPGAKRVIYGAGL